MTWVYLAVLAAALLPALNGRRDLLSPARVFICLYSLLLALYSLKLSRLQTPWSISTHYLFWGGNAMFLTGAALATLLRSAKFPRFRLDFAVLRATLAQEALAMDWRWFFRITVACALIFFASYAVSAAITGGIPALAKRPDEARIAFFGANIITNFGIFFGPIALMLCAEMMAFAPWDRVRRWQVLFLGASVLVVYLTLVTRYDIFRFIIFSLAIYHYRVRALRTKHLAVGISVIMVMFMTVFLLRFNMQTLETFNEFIKVKMPPRFAWASGPYAYLANDFWNMDYAFGKYVDGASRYPVQYGFGLFRAPMFLLHLDGLGVGFGFDSIMNESIIKVKGFNTVIYVWHFYKDFGAIGVFALSLAFGLIVSIFYQNTLMKPTVFRIALWALALPAVVLSYHAPLWELWFFYMNILVLMVAHRKISAA